MKLFQRVHTKTGFNHKQKIKKGEEKKRLKNRVEQNKASDFVGCVLCSLLSVACRASTSMQNYLKTNKQYANDYEEKNIEKIE